MAKQAIKSAEYHLYVGDHKDEVRTIYETMQEGLDAWDQYLDQVEGRQIEYCRLFEILTPEVELIPGVKIVHCLRHAKVPYV